MPVSVPPIEALNEFLGATTRHTRRIEIFEQDGTTRWEKDKVARLKDGTVSVDYSRDERRSLDLTLSNDDGVLVSAPGEFWYDKIIKVFRGVQVNGSKRQPKILIASDLAGTAVQGPSLRAALLDLGFGDIQINPLANDYLVDIDPFDIIIALGDDDKGQLLKRAYDAGKAVFVFRKSAELFYNALQGNTTWASATVTAGDRKVRRTNWHKNPQLASGNLNHWGTYAGSAGVVTVVRTATGGPIGTDAFQRMTWTTASTGIGGLVIGNTTGHKMPVTPGETVAMSVWVRSSVAKTMNARVEFRTADDTAAGGAMLTGPAVSVPANVWTRLYVIGTVPAGSGLAILTAHNTSGTWAVNDFLDGARVLMEKSNTVNDFFDGTTADTQTLDYAWAGTANDSYSTATSEYSDVRRNLATDPRGVANVPTDGIGWHTNRWFGGGSPSGTHTRVTGASDGPVGITTYLRKTWTVGTTFAGDSGLQNVNGYMPVTPGEAITISSYLRASSAGKSGTISCYWYDTAKANASRTPTGPNIPLPAGQWTRVTATVTVPAGAAYLSFASDIASGGAWGVNDTLDGTGLLVDRSSTVGDFFDGATADTEITAYEWAGAVNNSSSAVREFDTAMITPLRVNDPRTIGYPAFKPMAASTTFKAPAITLPNIFTAAYVPTGTTNALITGGSNSVGGKFAAVHYPLTQYQYNDYEFRQMILAQMNWLNPVLALARWEVQVGEFMIDRISEQHFPYDMKITGRDYTKKCMLSKFTEATQYAAGSKLEDVIGAIAVGAGVMKRLLPATGVVIGRAFFFERGKSRWEAMKELATAYNHELFFDATGYLVLRPFRDPTTTAPVLYIQTGKDGQVASYEKSTSDSMLFNHVLVIGENSDSGTPLIWAEAKNTDPNSKTSIQEIGDRYTELTSAFIETQAQAQALADSFLAVSQLEEFELSWETLMMPWLEVGDIIGWVDPNPAPGDPTTFLLSSLDIPLSLSPMGGNGRRVTKVGS